MLAANIFLFIHILLCGECLGWQHSISLRKIHCLQIFWHTKVLIYTISFKTKHTASDLLNSAEITKIELSYIKKRESDKVIVKICVSDSVGGGKSHVK